MTYDGKKMSDEWYYAQSFQTTEGGETVEYILEIRESLANQFTLKRNGVDIIGNLEGAVSQDNQSKVQQSQQPQKEILVKEIILVVCPHCNHRNDSGRRTCEKCHASI